MNVSLTPELNAFLERKVASGRYQTTSEVVREALRLLERQDEDRSAALRELKVKLERGARQAEHGEFLDGEAVFEGLKGQIAGRRKQKSA